MLVSAALVSGSLGQAVYREGASLLILDTPDAEPREAHHNEVQWFRYFAREVVPADPDGLPISIDRLRGRLDEEIRFFKGLDGLLIGMDRDFSPRTRQRGIQRAEEVLSSDAAMSRRIRRRFLVPANAQEWDPAGALMLALENGASIAAECYRLLANGLVNRIGDDIAAVMLDKLGTGLEAAQKREIILRSGALAELATIEGLGERASSAASALLFRRNEFPQLQAVDPSGQILVALINRIKNRTALSAPREAIKPEVPVADDAGETDVFDTGNAILAAVEEAAAIYERRKQRSRKGSSADLPDIQREITWIGDRLRSGDIPRAEQALVKLIDRQARRSRPEDIIKTLTAVADLARNAKHFDWVWQPLAAIEVLGRPDAHAMTVRGQTLRELGRYDEALAAFEETMRRFPQNEVAPTARAETLRELGRYDEALAAFEDIMRRFPQDEVAPTARAETLRDLGRYDEALAAFEETMRRFPQNEVAPNARAETLRELGRYDEALAAFEETMRRFPDDEVARNARAETLRVLGRHDEALAAFEETMRRFPQNEVAPNARAETLRDLGRYDEALAAFEETMRRFPHEQVTRVAYAHLVGSLGQLERAEILLADAANRLRTRDDWVAAHILAMARLRVGRSGEALVELERGVQSCPFADVRRYFETAWPLALLAERNAAKAAQELDVLSRNQAIPRDDITNIVLFQVHALAEAGEPRRAKELVESTQVIDFSVARQKRLAAVLSERYGLGSGIPASGLRARELNDNIAMMEFQLARPKLWSLRTRRAA